MTTLARTLSLSVCFSLLASTASAGAPDKRTGVLGRTAAVIQKIVDRRAASKDINAWLEANPRLKTHYTGVMHEEGLSAVKTKALMYGVITSLTATEASSMPHTPAVMIFVAAGLASGAATVGEAYGRYQEVKREATTRTVELAMKLGEGVPSGRQLATWIDAGKLEAIDPTR